jgi:hypothetical protein
MANVFFSYSHKDESLRNELENHLAMLKRDGTITTWNDRRILAGSDLDQEIDLNLEQAEIILLLVSASFLASEYCYQREMTRALEKHAEGSATVIPVILKPCDWTPSPFGNLLAVPTDGRAVTMFGNQDDALSIVAKAIRKVAEKYKKIESQFAGVHAAQAMHTVKSSDGGVPLTSRSSNLRIKRKFDDHECAEYLENCYEYMARYFEGSLHELQRRNPQIKTKFKRIDANAFAAWIYEHGNLVSQCSVYSGGVQHFGGDAIRFSNSADASRNSFNDMLSVDNDGYTMHLRSAMGFGGQKNVNEHGAAELYWANLIQPLQN